MKKLVLLFAALLVAGCGEKSLSDSAIKKALKEAVEYESLQERNDLYYQVNESEPYSGWVKEMYDSGQAEHLFEVQDGKKHGRALAWEEDGTKAFQATYKKGALEGPEPSFTKVRIRQLTKEAVELGSLQERNVGYYYDDDGPYTGWVKVMYSGRYAGQVHSLYKFTRGAKTDWSTRVGFFIDGQKAEEVAETSTSTKRKIEWGSDGQKRVEMDGKGALSDFNGTWGVPRYWNSKGEEVETWEEAQK